MAMLPGEEPSLSRENEGLNNCCPTPAQFCRHALHRRTSWICIGPNSQWKFVSNEDHFTTATSAVVLVKVRMRCRTASVHMGEVERPHLGKNRHDHQIVTRQMVILMGWEPIAGVRGAPSGSDFWRSSCWEFVSRLN